MKKILILWIVITSIALITITAYATTGWYQTTILGLKQDQKLSFVSGIVRQQENGTWFVQNDTNHTPLNISSVGVVGDKIRINYQSPVKKIVSLVVTPDNTLAKKGYVVSGFETGLRAADFGVGRMLNLYGGINYNPSTSKWNLMYQNSNEYTLTLEQLPNGVLRVRHAQDDFGLIPTQLTARDGGYTPKLYLFNSHYFDVRFYDDNGNLVTTFDAKCNFLFNRSGYRMVDVTTEMFPSDGNFWIMGVMEIE